MAAAGGTCSGDLNTIFPTPNPDGDKKYRFFNQPIEQIPGYVSDKPQILVHRPNSGLQWFTLDQCLPVVTCLDLQSDKLRVERRSVVILKDFEIENDTECDIDITDCESSSS
jgi:hypothetical protein